MDAEKKAQLLREEIEEITLLIKKWEPAKDADTRWAICMLQMSLERRKESLKQLLNTRGRRRQS